MIFHWGHFGEPPLVTIVIVVIDEVIDFRNDRLKVIALLEMQLVFHVAEERFLRSVVPTVASSGHGLKQFLLLDEILELIARVMDPLIRVNHRAFCECFVRDVTQNVDRIQDEGQIDRLRGLVRHDFMRCRIENRREEGFPSMRVVQIGDVGQKNLSRDLLLEVSIQKIVMDGICLNGTDHAAIGVRFADRAE